MRMIIIFAISFLLAIVPLLIALFFLWYALPRKLLVIENDVKPAEGSPADHSRFYTAEEIKDMSDEYFGISKLTMPSALLAIFYFAGFLLCDSYLQLHYVDQSATWLFPPRFVEAALPLLYAFIGVYLFNLGTMVRRLYLADINANVFWGSVNHLLLSMGLALIIMKSPVKSGGPALYFSIGFLTSTILNWVLEGTMKLLTITQPKRDEVPLQMIRGIDIWKQYRLEEEGIEDAQNLATADVVDLAVRTHYSVRTLVDWMDQSIILTRLTYDQVRALASQAMALSAVELAAAAPENNNGDRAFSDALAALLKVHPLLMAATLDRLYEDEDVRSLWDLWQSGTDPWQRGAENATSGKVRIPLAAPKLKGEAKPDTSPAPLEQTK